jgi:hypothetical protein
MKIKIIILILTSIALHANNDEAGSAHIKELEELRFAKITETAAMSKRIFTETELCSEYEAIALQYWQPTDEDEIEKEKSFKEFIIELYESFDTSNDYNLILNKAPLFSEDTRTQLDLVMLRVVLQRIFITELTIRYKQLITQVAKMNQAIENVKTRKTYENQNHHFNLNIYGFTR